MNNLEKENNLENEINEILIDEISIDDLKKKIKKLEQENFILLNKNNLLIQKMNNLLELAEKYFQLVLFKDEALDNVLEKESQKFDEKLNDIQNKILKIFK